MKEHNDNNETDLLTLKEASKFLKFKASRTYNEVFHKRIPHIKIGASLRFSKADLIQWIESQKRDVCGK